MEKSEDSGNQHYSAAENLPKEMVVLLMSYLTPEDLKNASLVCKLWRQAFVENFTNKYWFFLAKRLEELETVDPLFMKSCYLKFYKNPRNALDALSRIQQFNLSSFVVELKIEMGNHFAEFVQSINEGEFKTLKSLTLVCRNLPYDGEEVVNQVGLESCRFIAVHGTANESTKAVLQSILDACPKIVEVEIMEHEGLKLQNCSIRSITAYNVPDIMAATEGIVKNLEVLRIFVCKITNNVPILSNVQAVTIHEEDNEDLKLWYPAADPFPSIQDLTLFINIDFFTEESFYFKILQRYCHKLKTLTLCVHQCSAESEREREPDRCQDRLAWNNSLKTLKAFWNISKLKVVRGECDPGVQDIYTLRVKNLKIECKDQFKADIFRLAEHNLKVVPGEKGGCLTIKLDYEDCLTNNVEDAERFFLCFKNVMNKLSSHWRSIKIVGLFTKEDVINRLRSINTEGNLPVEIFWGKAN